MTDIDAEELARREALMVRVRALWDIEPDLRHPNPAKRTYEWSIMRLIDWALKKRLDFAYTPYVPIYLDDAEYLVWLVEAKLARTRSTE